MIITSLTKKIIEEKRIRNIRFAAEYISSLANCQLEEQ